MLIALALHTAAYHALICGSRACTADMQCYIVACSKGDFEVFLKDSCWLTQCNHCMIIIQQ